MLPYGRQSISAEDISAVAEVLEGDWLTTGPQVQQFEKAVSALTGGLPTVSCSSGTAALHMAYAALGIGPGDEVVTTPMTFIATASGASLQGADVVFADVDPETGLLDAECVASVVTERTRVITAVDYAGHPCDWDALTSVAASVGAVTVSDAAHSVGGSYRGRPVGSLANVTTMSFFPTKNLTTGEGGAVVAQDPEVAKRAAEFHNIGLVRDPDRFEIADQGPWHQEVHVLGLNYRLTDIGAALGVSQLRRLRSFVERRAEIKARYDHLLADIGGVLTPPQAADVQPAWHLYPLRVLEGRRREVYEKLRARGIGVQVNYLPVYWHPAYARRGYRRGMCPNAEAFYEQELSLPLFPDLTDEQIDRVVDEVRNALQ